MTYSHGRPPYMAVFGQIPRVGGGLLQDDRALVTHQQPTGSIRPDVLRAEAIKALAEPGDQHQPGLTTGPPSQDCDATFRGAAPRPELRILEVAKRQGALDKEEGCMDRGQVSLL